MHQSCILRSSRKYIQLPPLRKESGLCAPPPFFLPDLSVIPPQPIPLPPKGFTFDVSLETALALLYLDLQEA